MRHRYREEENINSIFDMQTLRQQIIAHLSRDEHSARDLSVALRIREKRSMTISPISSAPLLLRRRDS